LRWPSRSYRSSFGHDLTEPEPFGRGQALDRLALALRRLVRVALAPVHARDADVAANGRSANSLSSRSAPAAHSVGQFTRCSGWRKEQYRRGSRTGRSSSPRWSARRGRLRRLGERPLPAPRHARALPREPRPRLAGGARALRGALRRPGLPARRETKPVHARVPDLARQIGIADRRPVKLAPPAEPEQLALAV